MLNSKPATKFASSHGSFFCVAVASPLRERPPLRGPQPLSHSLRGSRARPTRCPLSPRCLRFCRLSWEQPGSQIGAGGRWDEERIQPPLPPLPSLLLLRAGRLGGHQLGGAQLCGWHGDAVGRGRGGWVFSGWRPDGCCGIKGSRREDNDVVQGLWGGERGNAGSEMAPARPGPPCRPALPREVGDSSLQGEAMGPQDRKC